MPREVELDRVHITVEADHPISDDKLDRFKSMVADLGFRVMKVNVLEKGIDPFKQDRLDDAREDAETLRVAAKMMLQSLGEYVRQTMEQNPEWSSGIKALSLAIRRKDPNEPLHPMTEVHRLRAELKTTRVALVDFFKASDAVSKQKGIVQPFLGLTIKHVDVVLRAMRDDPTPPYRRERHEQVDPK